MVSFQRQRSDRRHGRHGRHGRPGRHGRHGRPGRHGRHGRPGENHDSLTGAPPHASPADSAGSRSAAAKRPQSWGFSQISWG
jgi:hypothetical protein